jgi:drug/metabolite transporter (DMT)-like permease
LKLLLLTAAALTGFAANSLLTRSALGAGRIDAATFTAVRLLTGALALSLITHARGPAPVKARGSWRSSLWLAGYAVCFTIAYTRLGASVGALVLFGCVQMTMIGAGVLAGERPARIDWAGLCLAATGLVTLTLPGLTAPDPIGFLLMAAAGACWGFYSLAGRRSADPLGTTTGNFARAALFGLAFFLVRFPSRVITVEGLAFAAASGSLASGVGYTLWYSVLPSLAAWRAAVLQLTVPVITALFASVLLHEPVTGRLLIATALISGGVLITNWPAWHRSR